MSAGPPGGGSTGAPPPDARQLAWDWGGHVFGAAAIGVGTVLSSPISWPWVGAGAVIVDPS